MILNGIHLTNIDISRFSASTPYSLYRRSGFTTHSTVGFESLALLKDGAILKASLDFILHGILGLAAVWIGDTLSRL
jgi:hypothetical protein